MCSTAAKRNQIVFFLLLSFECRYCSLFEEMLLKSHKIAVVWAHDLNFNDGQLAFLKFINYQIANAIDAALYTDYISFIYALILLNNLNLVSTSTCTFNLFN